MDEELVHEIHHTQPKMCHQTHVLFALIHLLYCSCLYIFEVFDHRHMTLNCFLGQIQVGSLDVYSTEARVYH